MANIIGTGIDVIEVARIQRALTRRHGRAVSQSCLHCGRNFLLRVARKARYQSYAARFASKEAAMKAMGTGWNRNVGWSEIEVVRERGKAPTIALQASRQHSRSARTSPTFT